MHTTSSAPSPSPSPSSSSSSSSSPPPVFPINRGVSHLQRFVLFETRNLLLISGSDKAKTTYKLLTFDRTTTELRMEEDPNNYTSTTAQIKISELLSNAGNHITICNIYR